MGRTEQMEGLEQAREALERELKRLDTALTALLLQNAGACER
jgi:hypothetical protein